MAKLWRILLLVIVAGALIASLVAVVKRASVDNDPSPTEVAKINADRGLVERFIINCLALSETVGPPPGMTFTTYAPGTGAVAMPSTSVNPVYYRIHAMNSALAERRVAYDIHWNDAFVRAELATWASVAIGLLTTVMVALTATELVDKATGKGQWIRISALILPAIGTAAAAATAFYEPGALLTTRKAQATAAEQLHLQIGQGIWKVGCMPDSKTKLDAERTAQFDGWAQRFQELVTRADAKGTSSSSTNAN